jgi:FXSXX-COOH protein
MNDTSSPQPTPNADGPGRIPLARLAAQSNGAASPALTRVVGNSGAQYGPGRVAVAAFNSSV